MPRGTLESKTREWNSDFGVSENETVIEVGESEERLDVFDFPGFRPILDDLDLIRGHGEAFRGQHVSEVFAASDMELAFVCTGKQSIGMEPLKYFLNMEYVFGNVVGIDEDVVQIYDDHDINHIHENVIHKSLKATGALVSPSGITNHSKEP